MQSIKEHNLKANHNLALVLNPFLLSVCNLSKNTIWKQITTFDEYNVPGTTLYAIYQRTQFESKSQPPVKSKYRFWICMQSIKEHNLKANHNLTEEWLVKFGSVCNLSKNTIWKQITTMVGSQRLVKILYAIYQRTQFESKSQHKGKRVLG